MKRKLYDFNPGDRWGCSVVIRELPRKRWDRLILVQCDCGQQHVIASKMLRTRTKCATQFPTTVGSEVYSLYEKYPLAPPGIKYSKVYELWSSIRSRGGVCEEWNSLTKFAEDFAELMGCGFYDYLEKRTDHVHFTFERIDLDGIWEKTNVTARLFFSGRAYHKETYGYWRLLGKRGLLSDELKDDYILFLTTFGEKQAGYVLRRINRRRLHSRENSEWITRRNKHREKSLVDGIHGGSRTTQSDGIGPDNSGT